MSVAVLSSVVACRSEPPSAPASAKIEVATAASAIEQIDRDIAAYEKRVAATPSSWIDLEHVALGYLARAHLSGRFDDYASAEDALQRAFRVAPPGGGPLLARARVAFTLHRFERVDADLATIEGAPAVRGDDRKAIRELRADLALLRGRYDEARAAFDDALAAKRTVTAMVRRAQYAWKTADYATAESLLEEAATKSAKEPETLAFVELQRGLMNLERGKLDDALAAYRRGDAAFGGWYLLQEHIAEILAEKGQLAEALAIYEDVAARTQSPELIGAMAEVRAKLGQTERAREDLERARKGWELMLARFPEAAYGHALDFFLEHGEPARAVELAEKNHALRPAGDASVALARAYLAADRKADAQAVLQKTLATPYRSGELEALAAQLAE